MSDCHRRGIEARGDLPRNPQDWGQALPASTHPRFLGPRCDDNIFLYYLARAGMIGFQRRRTSRKDG